MNEDMIIRSIKQYIDKSLPPNNQYNRWTIGITHNEWERKAEHKRDHDLKNWKTWKADSLTVAQAVEHHFKHEVVVKMKGGVGGNMMPTKATWVYVF